MPEMLPIFFNAQYESAETIHKKCGVNQIHLPMKIYFKGDHIFYKSTLKNVITLNN